MISGLYFDAESADFTLWVSTFENEVYANWVGPAAAPRAFRGHVNFEFTAERNGTISSPRMLESTGTASLDEAAEAAPTKSHFAALPADYGPWRVTMRVNFFYFERS